MVNLGVCADWCEPADVEALPGGADLDNTAVAEAIAFVSDVLYRLSGHRWPGVCERTVRPVAQPTGDEWSWWPFGAGNELAPVGWGQYGLLLGPGTCRYNDRRLTATASMEAITLGAYPVLAVSSVMIDGAALNPDEYQIVDDRWLQRLPNSGSTVPAGWPSRQRLDLPDTEPGTWSVTFTFGGGPPPSGEIAARVFALEFAKLWDPAVSECRLDPRVQSVTREGVTLDLLALPEQTVEAGFGLPEVAVFLKAVNPDGKQRRAHVINPDRVKRVIRTGSTGSGSS